MKVSKSPDTAKTFYGEKTGNLKEYFLPKRTNSVKLLGLEHTIHTHTHQIVKKGLFNLILILDPYDYRSMMYRTSYTCWIRLFG